MMSLYSSGESPLLATTFPGSKAEMSCGCYTLTGNILAGTGKSLAHVDPIQET